MARVYSKRSKVRINRQAIDGVRLAIADGLFEAGKAVIEAASPMAPDSPYDPYPEGEGLPKQGGVLGYVDNKKVNGWHIRGVQPKKPRAARGAKGIVVFAGFGFPGRFAHNGTVRQPANPFLARERDQVEPRIPSIIKQAAAYRIARIRSIGRA